MRKGWIDALAMGTLLAGACAAAACAAGTTVQGAPSGTTTTSSTQPSGVEDSGTGFEEDSSSIWNPPPSEDSGSSQPPPPVQDSGNVSTPPQDSGAPVVKEDAGSTPISEDSGTSPPASATCADNLGTEVAWSLVQGTTPVCTTNADCAQSECCFVPSALLAAVSGGVAACISP